MLVCARMLRALLLASFVMTIPGVVSASDLDDPFPLRDQLPFKLLFLDQAPAGADVQPARGARFALSAAYENTMVATDDLVLLFERTGAATYDGRVTLPVLKSIATVQPSDSSYILDGETLRTVLNARVGLTPGLEIGVELPFLTHSSGFLDGFIDSFHSRLSLPEGGRTGFAHNQFRAGYIGDGETVYFDRPPDGFRLGDIVLSITGALLRERSRAPAVNATLSAKFPTGDFKTLDGSGSVDYGGALRVSKRWGRSAIHGGYAFNVLGDWRLAPGLPIKDSRSLFVAYAYSPTPRTSLIGQVLRTGGPFPFRPGNDLGKVAMEVFAGFRHRPPRGPCLESGFIENIDPFYNTPDIGAFVGFTYSMPPAGAGSTAGSSNPPTNP